MARALEQILQELNSVYDPQRQNYNAQIQSLDPAMQAEEKGLQQAKTDAFQDINTGANRRGLLFSGIPIDEQAKYTGAQFLPAVANLKSRYAQQRFNLQDALNNVNLEQRKYGQSLYNDEVSQDLAREAAARAGSGGGLGGFDFGGGGGSNGQVLGDYTEQDIMKQSLADFLARQYKAVPNATRAQQDNWVRLWANQSGQNVSQPGDPNGIWAYYNTLYPYEKYNRAASSKPVPNNTLSQALTAAAPAPSRVQQAQQAAKKFYGLPGAR